MKLALAPLAFALGSSLLSLGAGCATRSAPSVATPSSPSSPTSIGTTSLTSAALGPSSLAPAAWETDEAPAAAPLAPTWGAPATHASDAATSSAAPATTAP